MIKFNSLLRDAGIDPTKVKLVRHQDNRHEDHTIPYNLWRANDGRFELYQNIQSREVFKEATFVAAFVVTRLNETLFAGLYEIRGLGVVPEGTLDPASQKDVSGLKLYDLASTTHLAEFRGKLIIDWGPGFRSWVQRAHLKDKVVIELRRTEGDPPFPGFLDFRERLSRLATVPPSWRETLAAVCGVYLLVCPRTGKQYVGSASGEQGFWGRWEDYVASGHGGNLRMLGLAKSDYQVSILETASSSATLTELIEMENRWKEKLRSREFGLNAN